MHTVVVITGDQRIPTIVAEDILWQVVFKLPKLLSQRKKLYDSGPFLILPINEIPILLHDTAMFANHRFIIVEIQWVSKGRVGYHAIVLKQGVKVTVEEENMAEQLWKTVWDLADGEVK